MQVWYRALPGRSLPGRSLQKHSTTHTAFRVRSRNMASFTLADDNEISAYVEDVRAFIDVIKHETAVLHSADIAFFREYLISLGATISAPETESQASSSTAAALSEDNIEDVQIFIELIQVDDTGAERTMWGPRASRQKS